ncbi:MAG: AAA family ATPase [bacterium]|nr:AAA family ATPase [bacterium]
MQNDKAPVQGGTWTGANTIKPTSKIGDFSPEIKSVNFGTLGPKLYARGLPVIPLRGKVPLLPNWQTPPNEHQIDSWAATHSTANVGLLLGHDDLAALDCDIYDEAMAAKIDRVFSMLHCAPCRIGQAPKRLYLVKVPGLDSKLMSASFQAPGDAKPSRIEVLSRGQQCVLAGVHPDTNLPFSGLDYDSLRPADFPTVSMEDLFVLLDLFEKSASEAGWKLISPRPISSVTPSSVHNGQPPVEPRPAAPASGRPGDDFNQRGLDHFLDRLLGDGWRPAGSGTIPRTVSDQTHQVQAQWLTRPGKAEGASASLYTDPVTGQARFHLFSSSIDGLEPGDFLINFAYAKLFCDGNMSKAASELAAKGFGSLAAEGDFADFKPDQAQPKRRGFRLRPLGEVLAGSQGLEWLIEDFLPEGSLASVFGSPASYKSFLALDLALSVAYGRPWNGHPVKAGPVVILNGEGHSGVASRIRAWLIRNDLLGVDAPLFVSDSSLALDEKSEAQILADAVDEVTALHGPPKMLLVDTRARALLGDENESATIGRFVHALDTAVPPETCKLVVHHTGHSSRERSRGSSAWQGALDLEFLAERRPDGLLALRCTKAKDFEEPPAMLLKPIPVVLDDDLSESLVLEYQGVAAPGNTWRPSPAMQCSLDILVELTAGGAEVDRLRWRDKCIEAGLYSSVKAFNNAVPRMLQQKLIRFNGNHVIAADAGSSEQGVGGCPPDDHRDTIGVPSMVS